jgi:hypothetical protein
MSTMHDRKSVAHIVDRVIGAFIPYLHNKYAAVLPPLFRQVSRVTPPVASRVTFTSNDIHLCTTDRLFTNGICSDCF